MGSVSEDKTRGCRGGSLLLATGLRECQRLSLAFRETQPGLSLGDAASTSHAV